MLTFLFHRKKNVCKSSSNRSSDTYKKKKSSVFNTIFCNNFELRKLFNLIICIIFCIFILIIIIYTCFSIYKYVITSPFFSIKQININGIHHISKEDILYSLNLHIGINCFKVDIYDIKKQLLQNKWVYSASIHRILPNSLQIDIVEKKPYFWIMHNNQIYYADIEGHKISQIEQEHFKSLPLLEINNKNTIDNSTISKNLHYLKSIKWQKNLGSVSKIIIDYLPYIKIIFNTNIKIYLDPYECPKSMTRVYAAINDIIKRGELVDIDEIWSFRDVVWMVKAKRQK